MSMSTIFYLCDGKNPACKHKDHCAFSENAYSNKDLCFHTTNPDHARNGTFDKNPDKRPFFANIDRNGIEHYGLWEGFVGLGKIELMEGVKKNEQGSVSSAANKNDISRS